MGRRLRANHPQPRDVDQLFDFLVAEWHAIPQVTLRIFVQTMRQLWLICIQVMAATPGIDHYFVNQIFENVVV